MLLGRRHTDVVNQRTDLQKSCSLWEKNDSTVQHCVLPNIIMQTECVTKLHMPQLAQVAGMSRQQEGRWTWF